VFDIEWKKKMKIKDRKLLVIAEGVGICDVVLLSKT
jgi:hypothetical protein